ncbi:hypothetical protein BRD56_05580 [Thermoplasmatales archaeon SW_10_69_26]|jgi:hypothetical protein|nr:MAG: hypothetical protein BRD56_05580 [Thermoplasmatales archaeon SW_10_69_26]
MTTFETIEKHETEFGNNNFVQVARKIAKGEDDDSSTEFISLTRGYLDAQGSRRYKTNLSLPPEPDLVGFVKDALEDV